MNPALPKRSKIYIVKGWGINKEGRAG